MPRIENYCKNCGESNGAKGDFCPRCGWKYSDIVNHDPNAPVPEPIMENEEENQDFLTPDKKNGGNTMKVLKTVLMVMAIATLCLFVFALSAYFFTGCNQKAAAGATTSETTVTIDAAAVTTGIPAETTAAPTDAPTAVPTAVPTVATTYSTASADGKYVLDGTTMDFSKVIGFVPDTKLLLSDLKSETLGLDEVSLTRDFQTYLNTERDGFGCLAGYTDGTNDYNQYYNHQSAPQVPAYSWMVHTGEYIQIPGVGTLTGSEGNAVMVLIINRTDKVYRFPTNSVTVIAGFQGWGRIWNGESKEVVETEMRLTNHYLTRLGEGVPETGFIGQTDQGAENASTVTVVTVEMLDVGQFRLIRAETVAAMK